MNIKKNLFFLFVRRLRDDTGSCRGLSFVADNNNRFAGFNDSCGRGRVFSVLRDLGSSTGREAGLRGEEEKA